MLSRLYALPELSPLWRLADLCYGMPSPLHLFDREGQVASFTSQRGSRQGCVLGTLLFCLGLQPALEQASCDLPDLTVSAYIDDIAVVGPLEQASTFLSRLATFSSSLGLSISTSKSSLLWASNSSPPSSVHSWASTHSIPLLQGSAPLLGSTVGLDPSPRQRSASEKVRALEPFFQTLLHPLFTVQASFLLLRICALPRFLFTCRTLPPRLSLEACTSFDELALRTAIAILRLDASSLPGEARSQLALPLRLGGFGIRSMVTTAPAAFIASVAAAAPYLSPPQALSSTSIFQISVMLSPSSASSLSSSSPPPTPFSLLPPSVLLTPFNAPSPLP